MCYLKKLEEIIRKEMEQTNHRLWLSLVTLPDLQLIPYFSAKTQQSHPVSTLQTLCMVLP